MVKKNISLSWAKPVTFLMSVLWVLMIPVIYYCVMRKTGEYRLRNDKESDLQIYR